MRWTEGCWTVIPKKALLPILADLKIRQDREGAGCHNVQSQPPASASVVPPRGAEQNVDDGYVLEKIAVGGSLPLPGVELRTSLDKRWSGTRVC